MQTATQFHSEVTTAQFCGRTITVEHLTPVLTPKEREKRKREIEQRLFDVFSKYRGNGTSAKLNRPNRADLTITRATTLK